MLSVMKVFQLTLLLVTPLLSSVSWAAPKSGKGSQPQKSSSSYARAPFPVSASKLPANYKGHDVMALYNAAEKQTPAKGRYESSSAYNERLLAIQKKPLYGTLSLDSPIAIVVRPDGRSYDADKSVSKARFTFIQAEEDDKQIGELPMRFVTESDGYVGSGLAIMNASSLPFIGIGIGNSKYTLNFNRNVSNDKAQEYENNLRAAYVGYFDMNPRAEVSSGGMIGDRLYFSKFFFVNMRVKSVIFFDQKSGTIYGRYNAK